MSGSSSTTRTRLLSTGTCERYGMQVTSAPTFAPIRSAPTRALVKSHLPVSYSPSMFAVISGPFPRSTNAVSTSPLSIARPAFLPARASEASMSVARAAPGDAPLAMPPLLCGRHQAGACTELACLQ